MYEQHLLSNIFSSIDTFKYNINLTVSGEHEIDAQTLGNLIWDNPQIKNNYGEINVINISENTVEIKITTLPEFKLPKSIHKIWYKLNDRRRASSI